MHGGYPLIKGSGLIGSDLLSLKFLSKFREEHEKFVRKRTGGFRGMRVVAAVIEAVATTAS